MTRSAIASAILLALTSHTFAQSADAPPSEPGNFRATLYSNAGGEIFWERSTDDRGAIRGYEVTRNGEILGTFDALSLYDPALQPDIPYVFTVVAIDNAGQRSSVATTTLGVDAPPMPGGPDAPGDLRVDVYSDTALELFWRREPAAQRLRYEIRQDGVVVATTNGVSHFTDELAPGIDYTFEVIAIDRQDRRSGPATLTVRTDADTVPPALAAPTNLRSAVYSGTAAELFWDRPSTPGLRYEVRRDGEVIATTDGVSFFDDTLASGTRYVYEIIALDGERRSNAAANTLTTEGEPMMPPPPSTGSIINADNRDEILANVLAVIDGSVYRAVYEEIIEEVLVNDEGLTVVSEETDDEGAELITSECEEGGFIVERISGGAQTLFVDVEIDACQIDGTLFDGTLQRASVFADGAGTDRAVDIVITSPDGDVASLTSGSGSSNPLIGSSNGFEVSRYEADDSADGAVFIEEASSQTFQSEGLIDQARSEAFFSARVTAAWTGDEPLEIRTVVPFSTVEPPRITSDDTTYTSGSLVAEAADGSRLTIDADNGDPASVTVLIEADGGSSAFTVPVGENVRIPCVQGTAEDSGEPLACSLRPGLPL